jgi:D-sedoheptulose 7-phosphate isomerase
MHSTLERYWSEISTMASRMPLDALANAAETLLACHRAGGTVFVLGNGGSAATASHLACDLMKNVRAAGSLPFRVLALTDNVPLLTAWGNDQSFESIFAEQLGALVSRGDVVVAISASGNSPNVLAAALLARRNGATVIALTGSSGGRLASLADLPIVVPARSIEQAEDAHMMIAHSLCVALRERLRSETALLALGRPLAREVGR